MVQVVSVPDWFEYDVGETKNEKILNRLFSQVMIDTVDLVFFKDGIHLLVERARRIKIVTERLLDDDSRPAGSIDSFPRHS
jgi:hypothetical protein